MQTNVNDLLKCMIVACICLAANHTTNAQIGINTVMPDSSSALDISSKEKGLLIPRLTTGARLALSSVAADGLMVYDTNEKYFYFFNGLSKKWESLNPWLYSGDDVSLSPSNKNVGIGKYPSEKLDVYGNIKASGSISAENDIITSGAFYGYGSIPIGGIIIWSGNPSDLPPGWELCDGGEYTNFKGIKASIPDLSGKFIVGYSSDVDYNSIGNTGGETTHILTSSEMPNHNHSITDPGHSHIIKGDVNAQAGAKLYVTFNTIDDPTYESPKYLSDNILYAKTNITINNYGGGQAHENRPPYYVIAYIIRTK
jgi:microcystin-dependent protein